MTQAKMDFWRSASWSIIETKYIDASWVFSGFAGGLVLLLLGIVWLASSNGKGLLLFQNKPDDMRALLKGITICLLVIALFILVANAIP
jgi:hypothetical protein